MLGMEFFYRFQVSAQFTQLMLHLGIVSRNHIVHGFHFRTLEGFSTNLLFRTKLTTFIKEQFNRQRHVVHSGISGSQSFAWRGRLYTANSHVVACVFQRITDIGHGLDNGLIVVHGRSRTRAEVNANHLVVERFGVFL